MTVRRLFFVMVLIGVSCSGQKETVNLLRHDFIMPVVIFPLGDERIESSFITRKAIELLGDFRNYDDLPDSITADGYQVTTATAADSTFIPPAVVLVTEEYLLLERDEIEMLASSDRNIQLLFFGTSNDLMKKQAAIARFISAITKDKKVAVVDVTSRQAYNNQAWNEIRTESFQTNPIKASDHIVLHSYREGEYCRIVSLGMSKFSLPELSVRNVACSDTESFATIINGLAQTILEKPFMFSDSTVHLVLETGKSDVRLKNAVLDEGDNLYPQLELAFVNKDYASPQEEQMALAKNLFGAEADIVEDTDHDEELLRASEQARQRLPHLKEMFNAGLAPGEAIMVKSPFKREDTDGNEWMWVEVTKWTDAGMEGVLQNDPNYVSGLSVGSAVRMTESEVFDYILMRADGTTEGNETGKIIGERSGNH